MRVPRHVALFPSCDEGIAQHPPGTSLLVMGRARATWLVDAIEARMHLPTLMAAAGLTTLRSIDRVLPHVRNLSPDQAAAALKEF